jgi:hypothetical protein
MCWATYLPMTTWAGVTTFQKQAICYGVIKSIRYSTRPTYYVVAMGTMDQRRGYPVYVRP